MVRRFLAIKSLLENSATAFGNPGITPQLRGHTERSPNALCNPHFVKFIEERAKVLQLEELAS